MRFALSFLPSLALLSGALAANSFAGANNFYACALSDDSRDALLSNMQSAGMKVLRTWVSEIDENQKASGNSAVAELEAGGIGNYNDDILNCIDQLMVDAHNYGIKLLIALYDVNTLKYGSYGGQYDFQQFYTDSGAIQAFNNRITYILNTHVHSTLGQPWSELGDYIFGLEPQNEPMIFDQDLYTSNLDWICNAAKQIRGNVGDPNQLIFTGGGSGSASVQSRFFDSDCAVDAVAIHDYNDDWDNFMSDAVNSATSAGKKLLVEEWGSSPGSGRTANLNSNIQKINSYGVPWLYWELITNADPGQDQDYEIDATGSNPTDFGTLQSGVSDANGVASPFDFSGSLAL